MKFPTLSDEQRRHMLEPPSGPVRVVIDTDTRNEIDDQFALAWALLSQDILKIEAIYAEPYSFQGRVADMQRAYDARQNLATATATDLELLQRYAGQIERVEAMGITPHDIQLPSPAEGAEGSYEEILVVFEKLGMDPAGLAFRGSPQYLTSLEEPVDSPAARDLVEKARSASPDDPLYVVAIGCLTNVASAMLMDPSIIQNIVVTWTAGFPTTVGEFNFSFNMEQDMVASKLLFDSGVPLVYLPGFHVGAQLRLSLPEMEAWVKGKGAIGDYLYYLYTNNPLYPFLGINDHFGRTWVIWDLINIAWLLNPNWLPSHIKLAPRLGDDQRWYNDVSDRHMIREAYDIDRDAIFRDFLGKLNTLTT